VLGSVPVVLRRPDVCCAELVDSDGLIVALRARCSQHIWSTIRLAIVWYCWYARWHSIFLVDGFTFCFPVCVCGGAAVREAGEHGKRELIVPEEEDCKQNSPRRHYIIGKTPKTPPAGGRIKT
jgi:hypothetical protein